MKALVLAFLVALGFSACSPDQGAVDPTVVFRYADGKTEYPGWCEGHVPTAYQGDDEYSRTVREGVQAWLAPYGVTVTTDQPEQGHIPLAYVLLSSGPSEECGRSGVGGLSVYALPGEWTNIWTAGADADWETRGIAHEMGHAIGGLHHVNDQNDVMEPSAGVPGLTAYSKIPRRNQSGDMQNEDAVMREMVRLSTHNVF